MLEVCIDSLESAINAIHGGADELEVCSSLVEGGLTPSFGLVKQIMEMVTRKAAGLPIRESCRGCGCDKLKKRAKVNVMIRCRSGSDFHYSDIEMETMLADAKVFKELKVDRYVFGALTETRGLDADNCKKIVNLVHPIPVTFHRALDVSIDPILWIRELCTVGFDRVLTSGQRTTVNDTYACDQILAFLRKTDGYDMDIMPGGGVNLENAITFIDMGCKIVHSSCAKIRTLSLHNNGLTMGCEYVKTTDEETVRMMKRCISGDN